MLTYTQAVAQFDTDGTRADIASVHPAALDLPYIYCIEWVDANGEMDAIFVNSVSTRSTRGRRAWCPQAVPCRPCPCP